VSLLRARNWCVHVSDVLDLPELLHRDLLALAEPHQPYPLGKHVLPGGDVHDGDLIRGTGELATLEQGGQPPLEPRIERRSSSGQARLALTVHHDNGVGRFLLDSPAANRNVHHASVIDWAVLLHTPRISGSQMNLCSCNWRRTGRRSASTHSASSRGSSSPKTGLSRT